MKEKVVNARVTSDIYEKLSERARTDQVSISKLLRSIIEDSVEVCSDISVIIGKKIKTYLKDNEVIGFQEYISIGNQKCANCEKDIAKGEKAYVVLTEKNTDPKLFLCLDCYKSK